MCWLRVIAAGFANCRSLTINQHTHNFNPSFKALRNLSLVGSNMVLRHFISKTCMLARVQFDSHCIRGKFGASLDVGISRQYSDNYSPEQRRDRGSGHERNVINSGNGGQAFGYPRTRRTSRAF